MLIQCPRCVIVRPPSRRCSISSTRQLCILFCGSACPPVLRSGGTLVVKAIPFKHPRSATSPSFHPLIRFTSVKRQWHLIVLVHTVSNSNSTMGQTIV